MLASSYTFFALNIFFFVDNLCPLPISLMVTPSQLEDLPEKCYFFKCAFVIWYNHLWTYSKPCSLPFSTFEFLLGLKTKLTRRVIAVRRIQEIILSRATSLRAPIFGGMRTWVEGLPAWTSHNTTEASNLCERVLWEPIPPIHKYDCPDRPNSQVQGELPISAPPNNILYIIIAELSVVPLHPHMIYTYSSTAKIVLAIMLWKHALKQQAGTARQCSNPIDRPPTVVKALVMV